MKLRNLYTTRKQLMYGALILVLAGQTAGLGWLYAQNLSLQKSAATKDELATEQRILNDNIAYTFNTLQKPILDIKASYAYFPELGIRLPYTPLVRTLTYSMRSNTLIYSDGTDAPEADISSTAYNPPESETVINCADMVRVKIESSPHTYNPHEKAQSVKLADGRVLQVYELTNEPECTDSWNLSVDPATLASAFQQAQSY
jgi:hypothetical protein